MKFVILFSMMLFLSGCFAPQSKTLSSTSDSDKKSLITASDFAGATSAINIVTGIKISWSASTITPSAYRVYSISGKTMNLLTSLSPNVTSFIDGSVTWGSVYTYVVRAVDSQGVEDTNVTQVSSLAWGSITTVSSGSRTSITVTFESATPAADEIRIYVQGDSSETAMLTTISGSTLSKTITGLREGFTYKVTAQAYVNSLKKEDGNTLSQSVTTLTSGYDDDPVLVDSAAWMNVTNVRAFGAAPGAPVHPSVPNQNPQAAVVELSFKSFNGFGSSTKYVVTRAVQGTSLDTSVTTSCTASMTASCRVTCSPSTSTSELTGTGVLHCRDEQVSGSPTRYRYTMSLLRTSGSISWVEPLSSAHLENYSVLVPMPPELMVLAQRDAVNYEMCTQQMNLTPDPTNHNRCAYTGIGALPYNTGPGKLPLNLTTGFYDFGYNLFVDRYEHGCKWTRSVDGGKCGVGGTAGDCIGSSNGLNPDNSVGQNGDVFMMLNPGISSGNAAGYQACYYKYNNAWVRSYNIPTSVPGGSAILPTLYSSNPNTNGGMIGSLYEPITQYGAWTICQGKVDANYGAKRLPRMREHRAYTPFPTVSGDLYYVTYAKASSLSASSAVFNGTNGYRCPTNINTTNYPPLASVNSVNALLSDSSNEYFGYYDSGTPTYYGGRSFRLNAISTIDCQGRYGLANVHTRNTSSWTSDNFNINSTTKILTGISSLLDSGNTDLLADISGTATGFSLNYTTAPVNATPESNFVLANSPVAFIAMPLGLPILSTTVTGYTSIASFTEPYGGTLYSISAAGTTSVRGVKVTGRWDTFTSPGALTNSSTSSLRCVLPAE